MNLGLRQNFAPKTKRVQFQTLRSSYGTHIRHHKYDCDLEYRLAASEVEVSHAKFHNLLFVWAWLPELEKDTNLVGHYQTKALDR